jgi:hypothetical protein
MYKPYFPTYMFLLRLKREETELQSKKKKETCGTFKTKKRNSSWITNQKILYKDSQSVGVEVFSFRDMSKC